MKLVSKSVKETRLFAKKFAKEILKMPNLMVLSLEGEIGVGKTTFTQGFAEALGIKEKVQSPTFVILKIYDIPKSRKNLIHVDAYRLRAKDFKVLGWKDFIKNPSNIILVEWGNKIKNILPKNTTRIIFKHSQTPNERIVFIQ